MLGIETHYIELTTEGDADTPSTTVEYTVTAVWHKAEPDVGLSEGYEIDGITVTGDPSKKQVTDESIIDRIQDKLNVLGSSPGWDDLADYLFEQKGDR